MTDKISTSKGLVTWGQTAGYIVVIVSVLAGFYVLFLIRSIVFLFLVAMLLAMAIEPLVFRIRRGPFSRGQGILIVYTGIMLLIAGFWMLTVPVVLQEARGFQQTLPRLLANVQQIIYSVDNESIGRAAGEAVGKLAVPTATEDTGSLAIGLGLSIVEALFSAVTVFLVAYYWLTERVGIKRAFTYLFPRDRRQLVGTIWGGVEHVLGNWVRGQLLLMLFVGVLAGIGYTAMGLRYALVLAVIAGLLEVVPMVGPFLGAVPAILVALSQEVRLAIFVAVYIAIIQIVESNLLVPRLMARATGVSPLTVVMGLLIGTTLGGISGALIAVPVAAATQVILLHLLQIEDPSTPEIVPVPGASFAMSDHPIHPSTGPA
jgi:predicted PurR-regulated permease PerM